MREKHYVSRSAISVEKHFGGCALISIDNLIKLFLLVNRDMGGGEFEWPAQFAENGSVAMNTFLSGTILPNEALESVAAQNALKLSNVI